jgi:subtilisin-like proprotein convertase family protein
MKLLHRRIATAFVTATALAVTAPAFAATAVIMGPGFDIPDDDPIGASATITVTPGDTLMDPVPVGGATALTVEVLLAIDHTWVGDLIITLTSPVGDTITLVDRAGAPWQSDVGDSSNLSSAFPVGISDRSVYEAEFMGVDCAGSDDVIRRDCQGSFDPEEALSLLAGINMLGDWTLTISDNAGLDVGDLQWWVIEFDYTPVPVPAAVWLFGSASAMLMAMRRRRR